MAVILNVLKTNIIVFPNLRCDIIDKKTVGKKTVNHTTEWGGYIRRNISLFAMEKIIGRNESYFKLERTHHEH